MTTEVTSYQRRVEEWLEACFPPAVRADRNERTHRFLEESLELAQASGCSREDVIALVEYVFGRPQGQLKEEVGGVLVTLASLCSASGIKWTKRAIANLNEIGVGSKRSEQNSRRSPTGHHFLNERAALRSVAL